jgi:hypothetical protein
MIIFLLFNSIFLDTIDEGYVNIEIQNSKTKTKCLKRRNYQHTNDNDSE